MSSILSPYSSSPPLLSSLFIGPPEAVPPTDDLEALQNELKILKQKTLERAKKAGNDLKTIEESIRRLKEKEKGKAKAIEKVKRERAFTPVINGEEPRLSTTSSLPVQKNGLPQISVASTAASSSRSSLDPRPSLTDDAKRKKKKRKREDGSDVELEPQKVRKGSPALSQTIPYKPAKTLSSTQKGIPGPDFSLPSADSLLPVRPPVQPTPIPGPSIQTEVKDDFSKAKQPSQVLVSTFYASIEPYLRPIKEEDVGFLEYTADEVEPFIMPKLGRNYVDVWEDDDIALYGAPLSSTSAARIASSSTSTGRSKWDPSTLTEQDLISEDKGHGPLTERLVSALLPVQNNEWRGVKAAEDAMEGRPANGATAAAGKEKLSVSELEQRIKDTMRYHGLLDVNPDYSEAVDDPIATALRQTQLKLRDVVTVNKARKARLTDIARDRLGYQEYLELRDSIDKNISNVYSKLQKKDGPKVAKKKKKSLEANGTDLVPPPTFIPCPAALGLGPDEDNQLIVPEQLRQLVQTRRQWVETVGGVFEKKQKEAPGRIWNLPQASVFEGLDEQVRQSMEPGLRNTPETDSSALRTNNTTSMTIKGKERFDDAMDVR